jgi:hypothetical protein
LTSSSCFQAKAKIGCIVQIIIVSFLHLSDLG